MRMDFYRAKLIGSATIEAFHAPLEWADVKGDASNFSTGDRSQLAAPVFAR
jgi:carbonic anhydrase/acetyltransferase-like protein (isoleucine patch superfamily)